MIFSTFVSSGLIFSKRWREFFSRKCIREKRSRESLERKSKSIATLSVCELKTLNFVWKYFYRQYDIHLTKCLFRSGRCLMTILRVKVSNTFSHWNNTKLNLQIFWFWFQTFNCRFEKKKLNKIWKIEVHII